MTAQWNAGTTELPAGQLARLQRATLFASMRGLNPIVSIYNAGGNATPNQPDSRAQYVEFTKSVVRSLPGVSTFIVGNEPNSSFYWQPQFDAPAATRRRSRTSSCSPRATTRSRRRARAPR